MKNLTVKLTTDVPRKEKGEHLFWRVAFDGNVGTKDRLRLYREARVAVTGKPQCLSERDEIGHRKVAEHLAAAGYAVTLSSTVGFYL